MAAISSTGKVINVGDQVSVFATVVSYTGVGGTARVTVQTPWTSATFVANANDMNAVEHPNDASHTALSFNGGKNFGLNGNQVTVLGTVTAISGSGVTASLSIQLVTSLATIVAPAGSCTSDNK